MALATRQPGALSQLWINRKDVAQGHLYLSVAILVFKR